jgi:hypothetical protein
VVAGIRTPLPIAELEGAFPEIYKQLYGLGKQLERYFREQHYLEGLSPEPCVVGQGQLAGVLEDTSGVCLPRCIPVVGFIAGLIETYYGVDVQGECGLGHVCAPCTNPLDGLPTGACD